MGDEAEIFLAKHGLLQKIKADSSEFMRRVSEGQGKNGRRCIKIERMIWTKKN